VECFETELGVADQMVAEVVVAVTKQESFESDLDAVVEDAFEPFEAVEVVEEAAFAREAVLAAVALQAAVVVVAAAASSAVAVVVGD
jgi:hypothetical protein